MTEPANKRLVTEAAQAVALASRQPVDADLTAIAALNSATGNVIASDGAGWIQKTYAQLKTALGLVKADVGLGNVDNTSDANKPVSTATATALGNKADLVGGLVPTSQIPVTALNEPIIPVSNRAALLALAGINLGQLVSITATSDKGTYSLGGTGDPTNFANWIQASVPTDVVTSVNGQNGTVTLGYTDVGADPSGAATSAQAASQPRATDLTTIAALTPANGDIIQRVSGGWLNQTMAQLKTALGLAKADVGLGNVDNTSDVNKPVSTAQASADALALAKASNLSDLASASTARTNLGLGTAATSNTGAFDAAGAAAAAQSASQPVDATLTALAGLATGVDKLPYSTGTDTFSQATLTAFIRTLLDDVDAATALATLGAAAQADFAATSTGRLLTSGESTFPRDVAFTNAITQSDGQLRLSFFTARKTETVNNVRVMTANTAAGATPTLVRVGLYTVDGSSGDITLVASTANDTTLLAAANTAYTKALSASYAKVAGVRYALGILVKTAATAPTVAGNAGAGAPSEYGLAPRLVALVSGQTDLPSTVAAGSLGNSSSAPYVAITP